MTTLQTLRSTYRHARQAARNFKAMGNPGGRAFLTRTAWQVRGEIRAKLAQQVAR